MTGIIARMAKSVEPYPVNGEFYPNEVVDLVSETAGKVVAIYFEDGDYVKKGKLLLKVDDADLQAQLSRARYQLKLQKEKLERQRALLKRESVSRESVDEMETECNIMQADIELLEVKIARTEIRAPFDGQMGFRNVSLGAYLQPSTKIATLTDNSVLRLEFYLPDRYLSTSLLGQEFVFHADGIDEDIIVKAYAVDPQIDMDTRTLMIRGRYHNKLNLLAGAFLKGAVSFGEEEYIPVPTQAVVPEMEGQRVWVVKEGKARSIPIESLGRDNRNVEVISGLQVGDTVLINGLMQLREGSRVKVSVQASQD